MTNEQIKKEFSRWIDAGKPPVWTNDIDNPITWSLIQLPTWAVDHYIYIVDDKHAELRKLQIDEPNTKFEYYEPIAKVWVSANMPSWNTNIKYRVKPKEWFEDLDMVGKPVWIRDNELDDWEISTFHKYDNNLMYEYICASGSWKYAKPVTCDDLYKGELK